MFLLKKCRSEKKVGSEIILGPKRTLSPKIFSKKIVVDIIVQIFSDKIVVQIIVQNKLGLSWAKLKFS